MTNARDIFLVWVGDAESPDDAENGMLEHASVLGAFMDDASAQAAIHDLMLRSEPPSNRHILALHYVLDEVHWTDGFVTVVGHGK